MEIEKRDKILENVIYTCSGIFFTFYLPYKTFMFARHLLLLGRSADRVISHYCVMVLFILFGLFSFYLLKINNEKESGDNKCKFWQKCKLYNKDNIVCNKNAGGYYPDGFGLRPAGCYVEMEEKEKNENSNNIRVF